MKPKATQTSKYINAATLQCRIIFASKKEGELNGSHSTPNYSLLNLLLNDPNYFDEWTESTVGQVVTYTSPTNQIFTYNASTGEVNITTP